MVIFQHKHRGWVFLSQGHIEYYTAGTPNNDLNSFFEGRVVLDHLIVEDAP